MSNIKNPFISRFNTTVEIDDNIYNLHDKKNIYKLKKKYNRVLILYSIIDINILDYKNFTKEQFTSICKNFKLLIGHYNMLYNDFHRYNSIIIDKLYLEIIDSDIELNNEELVITFFGLKEEYIKIYLEQYISNNIFTRYINLKEINDYVNHDYVSINYNLNNMLSNLNESNYWSHIKNCKLNITIPFCERTFKNEIKNIKNEKVLKIMKKVDESDNDYLLFMKRNQLFTDISSNIKKDGYNNYLISDNYYDDYDKVYNIIVNIKNKKELYLLVMNLLVSKEYCHLIINNYNVMRYLNNIDENNESFISKYYIIFKYVLSYCWITLYMEEAIKKSMIEENDRFVFSINTANLLPYYPFNTYKPCSNPYFSVLIDKKIIDIKNNFIGVGCTELTGAKNKNNKIVSLNEFKNRLQIFINTSYESCNIFENIIWDNIAISGSIISACLPKTHPLMFYFYKDNNYDLEVTDEAFLNYINHFYKSSDLDIMCNKQNIFEFIDKAIEIYDCISDNIAKINKNVKTEIIENCSTYININKEFIENKLVNKDMNFDHIISNLNDYKIKEKIYYHYKKWKLKEIEKYIETDYFKNEKYNIFFNFNKNIIIKYNKDQDENLKIYENLKFKIKANKILKRDIEFFKIKYPSFFSTVSRFHLPCVRAYYSGNDVKILPTCITAMMTFMNIDYKYFAGTSSPYEIINKYRFRGFGTILNDNEKINLVEYSKRIKKWQDKYQISNNIQSIKNVFDVKNILFTIDTKKFYNIEKKLISSKDVFLITDDIPVIKYMSGNMKTKHLYKFYDDIETVIKKNGYIRPFKKYFIDIMYDISNNIDNN